MGQDGRLHGGVAHCGPGIGWQMGQNRDGSLGITMMNFQNKQLPQIGNMTVMFL